MKDIKEIINEVHPSWVELGNELYYPTSDEDGGLEFQAFIKGVWSVLERIKELEVLNYPKELEAIDYERF